MHSFSLKLKHYSKKSKNEEKDRGKPHMSRNLLCPAPELLSEQKTISIKKRQSGLQCIAPGRSHGRYQGQHGGRWPTRTEQRKKMRDTAAGRSRWQTSPSSWKRTTSEKKQLLERMTTNQNQTSRKNDSGNETDQFWSKLYSTFPNLISSFFRGRPVQAHTFGAVGS